MELASAAHISCADIPVIAAVATAIAAHTAEEVERRTLMKSLLMCASVSRLLVLTI
jgi:hypothetical protein